MAVPLIALEVLLGGVPLVWAVWELVSRKRDRDRDRDHDRDRRSEPPPPQAHAPDDARSPDP